MAWSFAADSIIFRRHREANVAAVAPLPTTKTRFILKNNSASLIWFLSWQAVLRFNLGGGAVNSAQFSTRTAPHQFIRILLITRNHFSKNQISKMNASILQWIFIPGFFIPDSFISDYQMNTIKYNAMTSRTPSPAIVIASRFDMSRRSEKRKILYTCKYYSCTCTRSIKKTFCCGFFIHLIFFHKSWCMTRSNSSKRIQLGMEISNKTFPGGSMKIEPTLFICQYVQHIECLDYPVLLSHGYLYNTLCNTTHV
jgi:hypothetical protein